MRELAAATVKQGKFKSRKLAARREATALEKRQYAKQFARAKDDEYRAWSKENDIYDLIDMRKYPVKNCVTGHWFQPSNVTKMVTV